jgi:hypothetical protein
MSKSDFTPDPANVWDADFPIPTNVWDAEFLRHAAARLHHWGRVLRVHENITRLVGSKYPYSSPPKGGRKRDRHADLIKDQGQPLRDEGYLDKEIARMLNEKYPELDLDLNARKVRHRLGPKNPRAKKKK